MNVYIYTGIYKNTRTFSLSTDDYVAINIQNGLVYRFNVKYQGPQHTGIIGETFIELIFNEHDICICFKIYFYLFFISDVNEDLKVAIFMMYAYICV